MAERYWVGGTGNWSDDTNHWATTSGGAPGVGNLPTASDNAHFDSLSNTTAYTVTVDAASVCLDLMFDAAPLVSGTITCAFGANAITASGSVKLLAGMTITSSNQAVIVMNATTGKTITSNGTTLVGGLNINGAGGTFTLQDALVVNNQLSITHGTLAANGKAMTVGSFQIGNNADAIIDISGITFACNGTFNITGTSPTFTVDTSSLITCTGTFTGQGKTFNDLTLNGTSTSQSIIGASTFRNLSVTLGAVYTGRSIPAGTTVTGTFTVTGNSPSNRTQITQTGAGSISAAAVSLTDADFQSVTAAGAAIPWSGTRIGNLGSNQNITFTAAAPKYWVADTGNWSDATNHWATASNGAPGVNNYPLPQDTATFDGSSFSANGKTVTGDQANVNLPATDLSAITKTMTLAFGTNNLIFYGDVTLSANTAQTGTGNWGFSGTLNATVNITSNGATMSAKLNPNTGAGTLKHLDNLTSSGAATQQAGTWDLNGFTLSVPTLTTSGATARTIKSSQAGGKIKTTQTTTSTVFTGSGSNYTSDRTGNNWSIEIGGNTANTRTFAGGGFTFPSLAFSNTTVNGRLNFTGSNTFKGLSYTGGTAQTIGFTAATTTTVEDTDGFFAGTSGNVVTIASITAAGHTLSKSGGGLVTTDYLSISRSTASPASTWCAGHNSTDGGNNSQWQFNKSCFTCGLAAAALSFIGSLATSFIAGTGLNKSLTAALSFVGSSTKQTSHVLSGALSFVGSAAKLCARAAAGSLPSTGTVIKGTRRQLTATGSLAGSISRSCSRTSSASLGLAGSAARLTSRALAAALSFAGLLVRPPLQKLLSATLSLSGALLGVNMRQALSAVIHLAQRGVLWALGARGDRYQVAQRSATWRLPRKGRERWYN